MKILKYFMIGLKGLIALILANIIMLPILGLINVLGWLSIDNMFVVILVAYILALPLSILVLGFTISKIFKISKWLKRKVIAILENTQ